MRVSTPFNHRVPKGLKDNLQWRRSVLEKAASNPDFAAAICQACTQDPLFFINGFGWTYAPKLYPEQPKRPFILYPFQEEAVLDLIRAIGEWDVLVEKSRDMGASWICVSALTWCWWYKSAQSILFVSRVEEYVDKPGNPKALFWKSDYLIDNAPAWLRPKGYNPSAHRSKLHIENPENGSVIDGESTTGNVARGDRRTAILLDEFAAVDQGKRVLASTRDATNCRIFNSTPAGVNNSFADMAKTGIRKLRLHWSLHPLKAIGLYTTDEDGGLKVLDPAGYPEGYSPILDGKLRSVWYDNECARAGSAQEIAQELDIDYLGSGFQFFNAPAIEDAINKYARPPMLVGELEYDDTTAEPIRFSEHEVGHLKLWFLLNGEEEPPKDHRYVVAADVSSGTGSSNSAIAVWDQSTCEKAAEYANPYARPEALAKQAIALCRWLGGAYLIWESNGPGRQFGDRVKDIGYGDVYLRRRDEAIGGKVSDIPGWASTRETKLALFGDYRAKLEGGKVINRSREALEETLEYIYGPDGGVIHARAANKEDPSGARDNHGDRVVADALAVKGIAERAVHPKLEPPEAPIGSLAWRQKMRAQEKQKSGRELTKKEGW